MEDEEIEVNGKICASIELTYHSIDILRNSSAVATLFEAAAGTAAVAEATAASSTGSSVPTTQLLSSISAPPSASIIASTSTTACSYTTDDIVQSEPTALHNATNSELQDVGNNTAEIHVVIRETTTDSDASVSSDPTQNRQPFAAPSDTSIQCTTDEASTAKSNAAKSSLLESHSQQNNQNTYCNNNNYHNQAAPAIKVTFRAKPKKDFVLLLSDVVLIDRHEKCHNKTSKDKYCCCNKAKRYANNFFVVFFINRTAKNASKWCLKSVVIGFKNAQTLEYYFCMFKKAFDKVCELTKRPKKLFVIVNPYGGSGKGLKIWETKAKPLFLLAGLNLEIKLTERAGHAYDLCYNIPFELYDGIIAVGGDGILNECVHALASRREEGQFDRCPIPMGLIPAGSTNCINEVATGVVSVLSSCLQIISGQSLGLDVIFLRDKSDQLVRVAFCSVAYGFFGDVLIRSEKLRCIGPIRYILAGGLSFIHLRTYRVDTDISLADVQHSNPVDRSTKCQVGCEICSRAKHMPPVTSKQTRNIAEQVAYVQVVANSCACKQSKLGISPNAHLGDGTMDMIFAHKTPCPHWDAVKMLVVHNSKIDRFGLNFIDVYRLAEAEIRIPPPLSKKEKKRLKEETKRLKMEEARKNKGRVSNSTSSSTLHSAMRHHLKSGAGGEDMDSKSYVMSETSGCPPSPVHDSGASPTEHSESSRDEDDHSQNRTMLSSPSPHYQGGNVSPDIYHSQQAMYTPEVLVSPDSSEYVSEDQAKKPYVYMSGRKYGKYKVRNSKSQKRQLTTLAASHRTAQSNIRASVDSNKAINFDNPSEPEGERPRALESEPFEPKPKVWISVENINALWNIDGEICESNSLKLHPVCQFFQFFAARPIPDSKCKHGRAMGPQLS